jgi:hypothetical protein
MVVPGKPDLAEIRGPARRTPVATRATGALQPDLGHDTPSVPWWYR